MSDGTIDSAQGLFDFSSCAFLTLLSFLLSRILFGEFCAFDRCKLELTDPDVEESATVLDATLEVSKGAVRSGDLPLTFGVSSTHPAGVGGTGPRVDIGAGRLVGGDDTRSVLVMLCDRD